MKAILITIRNEVTNMDAVKLQNSNPLWKMP